MSVLSTLRHVTLLVAVGLAATAGYEYRDVRNSSWSEEHVVALVQDLIPRRRASANSAATK